MIEDTKLKCPKCNREFLFNPDKLSKNDYAVVDNKFWFSCPLCGKLLSINLNKE